MRFFTLALCAYALTPAAFAAPALLSDTADIARYSADAIPDAKLIDAAKSGPAFLAGGASYKAGLHLTAAPAEQGNGTSYQAAALLADRTGRLFYRKLEILVSGSPRKVADVKIVKDIDLSQMHFSVNTGLEDRLVVVDDAANDVTLAFPLGVGGIDEAVMGSSYRILTPKFHGATLQRKTVIAARSDPAYYRHRPFMPITTAKGTTTAIAFHITILDDDVAAKNGLNYLVRGFESHGCMRMREKDLLEFFTIVEKGADDKLPVNVDNHVFNRNEQGVRDPAAGVASIAHAYPVNTESYMRVTYFQQAPHYQRDSVEHLVMMDRAQGQPDLRRMDALSNVDELLLPSGEAPEADADLIYSKYDMP